MRAWVLAGAAARGAYQAGVMSTLKAPDVIVGTSVGALNGAAYAHVGAGGLLKLWAGIKSRTDVFGNRWNPFGMWTESIWTSDPLRKLIDKTITGKPAMPWYAAYTDLNGECLSYGTTKEALLASASLPVIAPPVHGHLVDGGVMENAPLRYAIDLGADEIVVITGRNIHQSVRSKFDPKNIIDIAMQSMDCMCAEIMRNDPFPSMVFIL
jgi:NTE family protein